MSFEIWLAFAAASAVLLLIPGPTVLLVVSYALGQGWRTALPMAVGVALGDFTAMTLSMLGVGALTWLLVRLVGAVRVRAVAWRYGVANLKRRALGSVLLLTLQRTIGRPLLALARIARRRAAGVDLVTDRRELLALIDSGPDRGLRPGSPERRRRPRL